jgi:hypothetical protein
MSLTYCSELTAFRKITGSTVHIAVMANLKKSSSHKAGLSNYVPQKYSSDTVFSIDIPAQMEPSFI